MNLLLWIAALAVLFVVASAAALYSYGRFARTARGAPSYSIPPKPDETPLDRLIEPIERAHPDETGLACVFDNRDSFVHRRESARLAGRSLDLCYYIWRDDMTGQLIARDLIVAADRGVRVRLLLDDVNVQGFDPSFRALNGHPGIEVRLFNPIRNRRWALRRGIEILLAAVRLNRRMHAKLWIADGRLAITGGRNIGDDYFDAASANKRNSRDADILFVGPLVAEAADAFDSYWNSGMALPIAAFWRNYESGLRRFRARLAVAASRGEARSFLASLPRLNERKGGSFLPETLRWTLQARMIADPAEKALGQGRENWMQAALLPMMNSAQESLRIATPYFVPGREGMTQLIALARRGVRCEVVTNSLSTTNHTLVHGAYRRYRRPLLAAGVRLYEFAAPADPVTSRMEMLHSKLFVVDESRAFIGSFNFDLRSAFLNIEAGVVFEQPELIAEMTADFERLSAPAESYRLELEGRKLIWQAGVDGPGPVRHFHEPEAPALRRGASWVIGHLPIHSYL